MNKPIVDQLDSLIADAILKHDENRLFTYRAIKVEFTKWKTAKCNVGKEFNSDIEIKILNTMANGAKENIKTLTDAGRKDLADSEQAYLNVLTEFLPKEPTKEDIETCIKSIASSFPPVKANMGQYMKLIKSAYPTVNGKLAAQLVNENLA